MVGILILIFDCLFSFANIKKWNLTYGMRNVGNNGNQKGNELFISNYPIETRTLKVRTLFDEHEKNTVGNIAYTQ